MKPHMSITPLTLDQRALLAAIREQPEEDTPRLMYADWLEENGEDARAELIRVQIDRKAVVCEWEAAGKQACEQWNSERPVYRMQTICPACQRGFRLRDRERALIAEFGDRWRSGPRCEACDGSGYTYQSPNKNPVGRTYDTTCSACHGTGDAGGLKREFWIRQIEDVGPAIQQLVRVEYERGMKIVTVPQLSDCLLTGEHSGHIAEPLAPSPWLLAVLRSHPDVVEVRAIGLRPVKDGRFYWGRNTHGSIPPKVFDLMGGEVVRTMKYYPTAAAAVSALGNAVVRWGWSHLEKETQS